MLEFPNLLFQKSNILTRQDCMPQRIDSMRVVYSTDMHAFRLEVACYPNGMTLRRLFVRHDKQRLGIGKSIVSTLKEICIERQYEKILLDSVLVGSEIFWTSQKFQLTSFGGCWKNIKSP